tara:strand:- start:926 stop:1207 length:282 start_codon:yes stop_codon:yes gene_type:complete
MDWKTSLDWYCSGNIIDTEDLEILETHYNQVIENIDLESSLEVAPKHICNQTKIPEGSSWIAAVAVVLDRLSPAENGESRRLIVEKSRRNQSI